jgi:uncharacterized repeat protein (TIGR02543 family)
MQGNHDVRGAKFPSHIGLRRIIVALLPVFVMAGTLEAGVTYYVAPNGSDTAAGTLEFPFLTITRSLTAALPGDQILVRQGTYRETLTPPQSGTASAPIIVANYPGETPVVSALDTVVGQWTETGAGTGIFRIPLPAALAPGSVGGPGFNQVFINGQMAHEARFPNKQSADLLAPDAAAIVMDDQYGFTGLDTSGFSAADLAGARFQGRVGAGWAWQTGVVLSHNATRVQLNSTTATTGWWWPNQYNLPSNSGIGYLAGKLAFLDADNEWAVSGNDLFIRVPGGGDPALVTIEAKARKWCANINGVNHVTLKGLVFLGGAVRMNGTGLTMEDCEASHLSHFQTLKNGYNANGLAEENGILMSGSGNILRRSIVRDTAGSGVSLTGTNHLITRNLFHHISYAGSYLAPIYLKGTGHTVSFNTIHDTGRYCIKIEGAGHDVSYNEGYLGGRLCKDYGLIGSWNTDAMTQAGTRTRITRNWLHQAENGGWDIYLDNGCRNFIVNHNVTWGLTRGLHANAPGFNNQFFHNTVVGTGIYNTSTYAAANNNDPFWTDANNGMQVEGLNNLLVPPAEAGQAFENFEARDFRPRAGYHFTDKRNPGTPVRALDPVPFHGSVGFEKPAGTDWPTDPFVQNPYIQVQLVPYSDPFFYDESFGQGQVIAGINDGFVGFSPDSGAYEWGPAPWKPGVDGYALSEAPLTYHLVTFVAQDGTTPNPVSKWVANGDTYGSLATTTRQGYSFAGWWTQSSGGAEVTASTTVDSTGDHTLYARWELRHPVTYTWTKLVDGNATGAWPEQANWTGGILPATTADTADFSTLDLTANSIVSLNGSQSINKFVFADTVASHGWTLAPGTPSNSTLALGGANPSINIASNLSPAGKDLNISAVIAGTAHWSKLGAGRLRLAGVNTFDGDLTIQTGIVHVRGFSASASSLGSTTGKTIIHSTGSTTTGGQLVLDYNTSADVGVKILPENIVIQGAGGSAAAIQGGAGGNRIEMTGSVTLDGTGNYKLESFGPNARLMISGGIARSDTNTGTLTFNASNYDANPSTILIASSIDNNGGAVVLNGTSTGSLVLSASGHDIGAVTVNGQNATTLKLGVSNALATNQNLTLTKGTFNLGGFDQTVNALSGVASVSFITNSGATASKLTIGNGGGGAAFSGVISDGAAAISLEKTGGGTQTLAGPNTYSGDTTVSGGTLVQKQVNPSNELSTVTIAAGAVLGLDFTGTDTVDKLFLGTPAVQVPAGTYNASHPAYGVYFSFGGSLEVSSSPGPSGSPRFIWTNLAGGNATGSWTEQANWSGGMLPTTTSVTADFSTLDLTENSTVSLNGNHSVNRLIFGDAISASHDWTVAPGTPGTSAITLGGTSPDIGVANRTAIISAILAGSENWTKTGAGTLLLNHSGNTFSGDVTVQTGVIEERRGALGTTAGKTTIISDGSITTGGQLLMNSFGAAVSVAEPVVIQGPGNPANGSGSAALRFSGLAACHMNGPIMLDGSGNYKIDVYLNPSHWMINGGIARSGANTGALFLDLTHWQQPTPVRLTINSTIDNNGGPVTLLGNTAGILQLDVAGHDLGDFTINGAYAPTYQTILKLGISDALTTTKNLTLTKGTFDLAGFDQTVNAIGGVASASLITNSGATASKLTIGNGGGSGTFSGVIADGTATISLEKTGGGTQTLAGPNTYSGDTTVSGGTLVQKQVNPSNELSTVSIADGAVLGLDFIGTDTVAKLFLGTPAVQVPAGTYNAAHPTYGNYFSLGGSLEVSSGPTPSSGFAAWITGSFAGDVVPADQQGPNDDPDGDGISNLVEYAIAGQDPTVPNAAVGTFSGLMLSFNKRQPLASDIIYYIEVSTDLGIEDAWQVVTPIVNDETTLSHTLPADQGKIFARLRITRP